MAILNPVQASFLGGVWDPLLHARIDMEQRKVAIKTGINVFYMPQGPAISRPGLRLVYPCKSDDNTARVIPFRFSKEQSYVLELGNLYMRVFKDKGFVDGGAGTPVEIVTPWTYDQLDELFFCQKADTMYFVHPDVQPRTLTRTSHTSWSLSLYSPTSQPSHWGAGSWPETVQFFEQRLWFGGTSTSPQTLNATVIGSYSDFSVTDPLEDTDAVEYTLDSNDVQAIQWVRAFKELMIGTVSGEWKLDSGSESTITPTSPPTAREQTSYGCAHIPPLIVGSELLYVEYHGQSVRAMGYDLASDSYEAKDLLVMSAHLTRGWTGETEKRILDWCHTRVPAGLIWAVLEDGSLISMTYIKEHKLVAWTPHESAGGVFESVCAVRDENEHYDAMYCVVKRTVKWRGWDIEDATDGEEDDTFTLPDGYETGTDWGVWVAGKFYRYKGAADITASGDTTVTFKASPTYLVNEIETVFNSTVLDTANWEELDDASRVRRFIEVIEKPWFHDETAIDAFYVDSGLDYDGVATTEISGLEHLEGMTVQINAGGGVHEPQVVHNGKITLDTEQTRVIAGLGYNVDIEILPVEMEVQGGSTVGRKKTISGLNVKVYQTIGMKLGIGGSDTLYDVVLTNQVATPGQPPTPYTGDIDAVEFVSEYETEQTVFMRQENPMPMTITAVVPFYQVTGE